MKKVWDDFLTERDKRVFGDAGYGQTSGLGAKPALLIIDVSYDFCGHKREPIEESIKTWNLSCGEEAWDAIEHTQTLIAHARKKRIPIIYTTGFDPRPDNFDRGGWVLKNTRMKQTQGVPGFRGNDIVAEIAPEPTDLLVEKLKPSAFHGTNLMTHLINLGVDSLIVTGTTTSGCVRASVVDAFSFNYRVGIVEECTFDRGEASHALALYDMRAKYADILSLTNTLDYMDTLETGIYDDKIAFAKVDEEVITK
ncbi:isochorismatase family protein [Alkalihalobacillus sp. 1P02AB]|uniref:isochorismatase family protein n=1 Tax=Alkalihalobacillus sp. 1P02AB TaxID=3132260 RepID=UPI0039A4BFD2